jgi:hypothetical protein
MRIIKSFFHPFDGILKIISSHVMEDAIFLFHFVFSDWYIKWKLTQLNIAGEPIPWISLEYYICHSCSQMFAIQTC